MLSNNTIGKSKGVWYFLPQCHEYIIIYHSNLPIASNQHLINPFCYPSRRDLHTLSKHSKVTVAINAGIEPRFSIQKSTVLGRSSRLESPEPTNCMLTCPSRLGVGSLEDC